MRRRRYLFMCRGVSLACLFMLAMQSSCWAAEKQSVRRVYIDESHEFRFAIGPMGKMLAINGYNVVDSLASFPPGDLAEFDVLSLFQCGKTVPFAEAELTAIREFVASGGSLCVIGVDTGRNPPRTDSLNAVVGLFGYRFVVGRNEHPITVEATEAFGPAVDVSSHWQRGLPWFVERVKREQTGETVIARVPSGKLVAVALEYGKGRVFIASEPSFVLQATSDEKKPLVLRIFAWLSRKDSGTTDRGELRAGYRGRQPDLVLRSNDVEVWYPLQLEKYAQFLTKEAGPCAKEIREFYGIGPTYQRILAVTGGGFAGPGFVGVGVCDKPDAYIRGFLFFESVNSTPLPSVRGIGESWAIFSGRVIGPKLDLGMDEEELRNPWAKIEIQVLPDDPHLDRYDISIDAHATRLPGKPQVCGTWVAYRKKKTALVLRDLYQRFGVDFIRRAVVIHGVLYGSGSFAPSFDAWVRELSLAAGEDLTPIFRRYGTTIGDLGLPGSPVELIKERDAQLAKAKDILSSRQPAEIDFTRAVPANAALDEEQNEE